MVCTHLGITYDVADNVTSDATNGDVGAQKPTVTEDSYQR